LQDEISNHDKNSVKNQKMKKGWIFFENKLKPINDILKILINREKLFIQYSKRYLHAIYYNEKALKDSEFLNTEESFHGNYIETVKMIQSEY
jgi:hypothetical protein